MNKPVKSVLASARVLMRSPSEVRLPADAMRLVLHQTLDEYNVRCLKKNSDYFTHELEVTLSYAATERGYTIAIASGDTSIGSIEDVVPVFFLHQDVSADPDTDGWDKVRISKLDTFGRGPGLEIAVSGNDYDRIGAKKQLVKISATDEWVQTRRWRIAFRHFSDEVLGMDAVVPFPKEHTALIEHELAFRCLTLVEDDSPSWDKFVSRQLALLGQKILQLNALLDSWLEGDLDNRVVTEQPYHYKYNNPLGSRPARPKVQF